MKRQKHCSEDYLKILDSIEGYRSHFMDKTLWEPFIQVAISNHFSCAVERIRPGLAGTYPTFLVNERWVIKFFGRLFAGARSQAVEQSAAQILAQSAGFPAPKLLVQDSLFPENSAWTWPYLVYEFCPGRSIGQDWTQLTPGEKSQAARWLGISCARLHSLPLNGSAVHPKDWQPFLDFLHQQSAACMERHLDWGSLPSRLAREIPRYLCQPASLILPGTSPHLIHADLTRDHLLGDWQTGTWQATALIDFGDARVGSLYYELAALHLDLFQADLQLLTDFIDAYGPFNRVDFTRRAMSAALLHEFDIFSLLPAAMPDLDRLESLEDLAKRLWTLDIG